MKRIYTFVIDKCITIPMKVVQILNCKTMNFFCQNIIKNLGKKEYLVVEESLRILRKVFRNTIKEQKIEKTLSGAIQSK